MAEATEAELSSLKVIELKQRLEGLGLDKTGKKAELVVGAPVGGQCQQWPTNGHPRW